MASEPLMAEPVPAEPVLEVRDLHYSYLDRFPALAGVSLTVERGEKLALLGANGCGSVSTTTDAGTR